MLEYGDGSLELVAFDNAAVKSATGNRSTFARSNPDIVFSGSATATAPRSANSTTPIRHRMDKIVDTLI